MQELLKLLAKFIATNKGVNLQKTDLAAHTLLGKWHKFQRLFKNRIEHFLPRIGENPHYTVHGQLESWNSSEANTGISVDIPTDYPQRIVDICKLATKNINYH